ncbi:FAD-dependent oxidoreductase [Halioxenophilus aromaticivorans]|uniref:FAD-dependent oxidoreductase n=1 Tax=Halioxenophilus aromaticivorans TaxID=1306992 RepID=A0AAV3U818_9ALTE
MSIPIKSALIIGGGFSGMSAAIALSRIGVEVTLIEIDPNWRTDGAGITVSGPSMRAIEALGLLPVFLQNGCLHEALDVFDAKGDLLKQIPMPKVPGSDIVGGGGTMRPAFAKAMGEVVRSMDISVKLGVTYTSISDGEDQARVTFSDGSDDNFDLVIGADGVFSSVRRDYFPGAQEPKYTGQGVWRAVIPRFGVKNSMQYLGKNSKFGFTPVSEDEMYLYYTQARPTKERIPDDQLLPQLNALLAEYTSPITRDISATLTDSSQILYRPLEGMLMPRPWYRGRLLLIGDCVHATTPHLASGAGMGHEDAVVLADELSKGGELISGLERFQNRRWERCRMIVANSHRLGEIEIEGGSPQEHTQIMALTISALLAPV